MSNKKLENFFVGYGKKTRILSFTGGEIFLLPDIEEKIGKSIRACTHLNIFSLTTNGFFTKKITKTITHILKQFPHVIIIINVSIDGDLEIHNKLRGNTLSYQNALHTYNILRDLQGKYPNLEVNREFLLSESNVHESQKHIRSKNTIVSIVQNSSYYGRKDINTKEKLLNYSALTGVKGYMKKKFLKGYISSKYNCYASRSSLFINWDGVIQPCIVWDKKIGNIQSNDILSDIKHKKYQEVQKTIKDKQCPGCWTPCEGYLSIIHEFWK